MSVLAKFDRRLGLLAGLCLVLSGVLAMELHGLEQGPLLAPVFTEPLPLELPVRDRGSATPPLADFAEITARPLFFPDRQLPEPDPEVTVASASLQNPARDFTVSGIVLSSAASVAILQDRRNGTTLHVAVGSEVGGWTVRSIARDGVTLDRGEGSSAVLALQEPDEKAPLVRPRLPR